jgi:hypothetical protein
MIREARPRPLGCQMSVARYGITVDNVVAGGDSLLSSCMVAFMSGKSKSKTKIAAVPGRVRPLAVFGPPLLLEGEDAAAYDELLARVCAAVKPADIIDEMFIIDIAALEWEVLRWRRLKTTLMQEAGLKELECFLIQQLESNYTLHEEHFKAYLATILRRNFPTKQADSLTAECAPNTAEANHKLEQVLSSLGLKINTVLDDARAAKAKELVQEYVRGERDAVTLVNDLLTDAGMSIDSFLIEVLGDRIDVIERIDRLAAIAETRRNAALREIDRRRAVLGETLRQTVQEIENDD